MTTPQAPGRRAAAPPAARGRLTPAVVAALLLPLLTAGLLTAVRSSAGAGETAEPTTAALTRRDLACPSSRADAASVTALSVLGDEGDLAVRRGGDAPQTRALGSSPLELTEERPVQLTGGADLAPGLLASRTGERGWVPCAEPAFDQWFTGVGARPQHRTVIELVNPDAGPAIADLTVLSPSGELDLPRLRGVRVDGHDALQLDLAELVPRRTDLAVHVLVQRGRLVSSAWESVDELGEGPALGGWAPAQAGADTDTLLLGVTPGNGSRKLMLANPGDSEARVSFKIVAERSEFAPNGVDDVTVPPGSLTTVQVGDLFTGRTAEGAKGLRIASTQPVTATLRSVVDEDLVTVTGGEPIERGAVALPPGRASVLVAGADSVGTVSVATGSGTPKEAEIGPQRSVSVTLPRGASYADVTLTGAMADVSVVVEGPDGTTVWPLSELRLASLVPDVRPALP